MPWPCDAVTLLAWELPALLLVGEAGFDVGVVDREFWFPMNTRWPNATRRENVQEGEVTEVCK